MRTKRWFLCGVIVTLIAAAVTAARAAETVKPLSLSESIDLALKRSVLIHAAREGVRGAEAQRKEAFTGFIRSAEFAEVTRWGAQEILAGRPSHRIYGE